MLKKEPDWITDGVMRFTLGEGLPSLVTKIGQGGIAKMHELLSGYWWAMESEQEAAVQKFKFAGRQCMLDIRV